MVAAAAVEDKINVGSVGVVGGCLGGEERWRQSCLRATPPPAGCSRSSTRQPAPIGGDTAAAASSTISVHRSISKQYFLYKKNKYEEEIL